MISWEGGFGMGRRLKSTRGSSRSVKVNNVIPIRHAYKDTLQLILSYLHL